MKNKFTGEERHAVVLGITEIICPLPPRYKIDEKTNPVPREFWYYTSGRSIGVIFWLVVIKIMFLGGF